MSEIKLSNYQSGIVQWVKTDIGNAIVQAVAGSGKTWTMLHIMQSVLSEIAPSAKSIFLAFNKSIQKELSEKVPAGCQASTLHSLGYKMITTSCGFAKVENMKVCLIMDQIADLVVDFKAFRFDVNATRLEMRERIKAAVEMTKQTLTDYNSLSAVNKVLDYYGFDTLSDQDYFYFLQVMVANNNTTNIVDYSDMIYLPNILNLKPVEKFDWIFVDETQDLNLAQIELVKKLNNGESRFIFVGDRNQSIYGFRGADSQAMDRIKEAFNAKELPLSVCYRCPTKHIKLAQKIVPHIEARDNAPEGIINHIDDVKFADHVTDNDLVLCRVNARIMSFALQMIAQGRKATIIGQDIGKALTSIVKKIGKNYGKYVSVKQFHTNLTNWYDQQYAKLIAQKASPMRIQNLDDKRDTLLAIADSCNSVECILNKIETLFADQSRAGVTFSTVHRAKGLEANNVFILAPELLPLTREGQKDWEVQQEMNIKYVALTRAKNSLTFVNSSN